MGTWEQRKLGEVIEGVSKKNTDGLYTQDDILACSLGTELDRKTIFYGLRSTEDSVKSYRIVNIGNVIYTKSPIKGYPNGIVRTCKIVDGIVPSLYCVYKKKENISIPIDTRFIQSYLEDKGRLAQYLCPLVNVGARNNVNITDKEFLEGVIKIPMTVEEQTKIVDALEKINHLITLHHRKSNIFIREWDFVWEQRKLGDLVDRVTRKNQDLVSELPLTISAQYGLIDQNEFFDKRVASKDVSGYYLIENGEFAYNKSTSTDAPWGAIKRLDRYENGVLSTLYIVFGIKENNPVYSDFLVSYYSTNLWHKGIHEIAAEGARNHGLLNIAPADFFETKLKIPQDIEEQKKIGKYFEELERLITLHHRKQICVQMG